MISLLLLVAVVPLLGSASENISTPTNKNVTPHPEIDGAKIKKIHPEHGMLSPGQRPSGPPPKVYIEYNYYETEFSDNFPVYDANIKTKIRTGGKRRPVVRKKKLRSKPKLKLNFDQQNTTVNATTKIGKKRRPLIKRKKLPSKPKPNFNFTHPFKQDPEFHFGLEKDDYDYGNSSEVFKKIDFDYGSSSEEVSEKPRIKPSKRDRIRYKQHEVFDFFEKIIPQYDSLRPKKKQGNESDTEEGKILPSYINCTNHGNNDSVIIDKNSYWMECKNGELINKFCIFLDHSYTTSFGCIPQYKIGSFFNAFGGPYEKSWAEYYVDYERTIFNCEKASDLIVPDLLQHKLECIRTTTKVYESAKDVWCKIGNKKIYSVDSNNGWYTCKNGTMTLQKCVFKDGSKYSCLSRQKIVSVWTDRLKDSVDNGAFCKEFIAEASNIYPNFTNDFEPCEDTENNDQESLLEIAEVGASTNYSHPVYGPYNFAVFLNPGGDYGHDLTRICNKLAISSEGVYYKCDMPFMCQATENRCLSFNNAERMFEKIQNSDVAAAWSDEKYNETLASFSNENEYGIYRGLENATGDNVSMFQYLAQLYNDGRNKTVTIQVGQIGTVVSPTEVCHIVMNLAPFKKSFVEHHLATCPPLEPNF